MKKNVHYGEYAFLAGILLSIVLALLAVFLPSDLAPLLVAVLAILGLVVGFSNIQEKESPTFLVAAIALVMVATEWTPIIELFTPLGEVGETIVNMAAEFIKNIVAFVGPAAFIVALKRIYHLARAP